MSKSVEADIDIFDTTKPRIFSPHPLYDNFGKAVGRTEALAKLGLDGRYRYLLFFGLIRDYKGLDWLLEAFANERLKDTNLRLIVAGEFYTDGEKYLGQARQLGIDDRIIWHTEFVPDSEVRYFFSAADLVVQPYKTATQSGVTQIAYHFERPMLVTNVGGLAEIVPDGRVGYVVEPRPNAVADAIVDFAKTPEGSRFVGGIREEKKKDSWQRMTAAIVEVMRSIVR